MCGLNDEVEEDVGGVAPNSGKSSGSNRVVGQSPKSGFCFCFHGNHFLVKFKIQMDQKKLAFFFFLKMVQEQTKEDEENKSKDDQECSREILKQATHTKR